MTDIRVFICLNLPNGNRIGSGKITLLEAIRADGSITTAARHLGMSYRRAWLLVQEINNMLQHPAITTTQGGANCSGAAVTPVGEKVIELYHSIEGRTRTSARQQSSDRWARSPQLIGCSVGAPIAVVPILPFLATFRQCT